MSSTKSGSRPWHFHFSADLPKMSSNEPWSCCCAFPQEFQGVLDKSRSFSGMGNLGETRQQHLPCQAVAAESEAEPFQPESRVNKSSANPKFPRNPQQIQNSSQRAESVNPQQIQNSLLGEELRDIAAPGSPDTTDPEIKSHLSRQGLKPHQRKVAWSGKNSTFSLWNSPHVSVVPISW